MPSWAWSFPPSHIGWKLPHIYPDLTQIAVSEDELLSAMLTRQYTENVYIVYHVNCMGILRVNNYVSVSLSVST